MKRIKVVLLGESSVGKSSLIDRIVFNKFRKQESTIGAAFHQTEMGKYKLNIWDTAGQERYLSITPLYYRDTDIVIIVYDMSSISTTSRALYYYDKLIKEQGDRLHCIIVGNKQDLLNDKEIMPIKRHINSTFANNINTELKYVSSKTGENIKDLKDCIANMCNLVDNNKYNIADDRIIFFEDENDSNMCCV